MDKALETQLANIQKRTGKTLDQLTALVKNSGLEKHGEMVAMLKTTLGMGHGDANTIVHYAKGHPSFSDSSAGRVRRVRSGSTDAELLTRSTPARKPRSGRSTTP